MNKHSKEADNMNVNVSDRENKKILSEFKNFSQFWRSSVTVLITILQYQQYIYLNELLSEHDLTNFSSDEWEKCAYWRKAFIIVEYLIQDLQKIKTNNNFEEKEKNENLKYLRGLRTLLDGVGFSHKKSILTILPPIPESMFGKTDVENKYLDRFQNLIHFYTIIDYHKDLSTDNLIEKHKIVLKKIFNKRQEFYEFTKNFIINDEQREDVLKHWMDFQNYFNGEELKNDENAEEGQMNIFTSFFKLISKNELKWKNVTEKLVNLQKEHPYSSFQFEIDDDVERLFLILLFDIQFDLKAFINKHNFVLEESLHNFYKDWRQFLHVPIKMLQFQQYHIHNCNLKSNESDEWKAKKENAIEIFVTISRKIINYIMNILNKMVIFPTVTAEMDQSVKDYEYLHNLLEILQEMIYLKTRNISNPLPIFPKLVNEINPINELENRLPIIAGNLLNFYQFTHKGNSLESFHQWNKELLEKVYRNFHNYNKFVKEYVNNQNGCEEILLMLSDFKLFLNKYKRDNKFIEKEDEDSYFVKIYRLIFNPNFEYKFNWDSAIVNKDVKNIDADQIQFYIILLLNVPVNVEHFYGNTFNNLRLFNNCRSITLQLLKGFIYNKIGEELLCFGVPNYLKEKGPTTKSEKIDDILSLIQEAVEGYNLKDSVVFYNSLNELKYIFQNEHTLNPMDALRKLEILQKSIINFGDHNDDEKQQRIINDLYFYWRIWNVRKDNFFEWNKMMFQWIFLNLDQIEFFIKNHLHENDASLEIWNSFKIFLLTHHGVNENDNEENNYNNFFQTLIDEKSLDVVIHEMEYILNYINIDNINMCNKEYENHKCEMLYILNLLDAPCSLTQMTKAVCWQNIYDINYYINCNRFDHYKILNNNKMNREDFLNRSTCDINEPLLHLRFNLNAFDQIHHDNFEKDIFCLDGFLQLPINFELRKYNNLFLINLYQIAYLEWYFEYVSVDQLKEKSFIEKIQYMFDYICRQNLKDMDEFINNYFGDSDEVKTFKNNWKTFKEAINERLPFANFRKHWKLLTNCDKYQVKEYFKTRKFYKSDLIVKVNEEDAGKHFLLILLNVPLSEVLKSQYGEDLSLDKLFLLMYHYKKLRQSLSNENTIIIATQLDLAMEKFTSKLENKQTFLEDANESSKLLVESKFNDLEYETKTQVIENLIDIVHSQNTFGYFIIIFKILLSLLPIVDIFLDISLAIKFFFLKEYYYCYMTIGILIITGFANVITEIILKTKRQWKPTYCVKILKYQKLRYFLSFTQITLFFRALNEAMLRLKIKKNKNNSYLDYINYGDPELLKKEIQTIKYVEMCFEAVPQTILQLFIILMKNRSDYLQFLSILSSICSTIATVWGYISSRDLDKELNIFAHRQLILREFCFYGLKIICSSLILRIFPWIMLPLWICVRFLINFAVGWFIVDDRKKNYLYFLKSIHSDLLNEKIYNILTLVEYLVWLYIFIVFYALYYFDNLYYCILIFAIYPILLFIWFLDLYENDFLFTTKPNENQVNNNDGMKYEKQICNMYCLIHCKEKTSDDDEILNN